VDVLREGPRALVELVEDGLRASSSAP